ncbi:MAG: nodulation protein NfeD [Desulfohalobiaceae bacterium]|nr:nodulation protein NfeD [Desulfohalobiaceae bacterium]
MEPIFARHQRSARYSRTRKILGTLLFCLTLVFFLSAFPGQSDARTVSALSVRIQGSINPAQSDMLTAAIEQCRDEGCDLLLLSLNTPGGLGQSMRDMVQTVLNSPVPVAVWVGPRGARAASAGTFIVAASSVASMSPETSIGSASPVSAGGKDISETMKKKIENDFVSLISGVASDKGRNVEWYEKAVREAASLSASEAAEKNVIDLLAESPEDLMRQIGEQGLALNGEEVTFGPEEYSITAFEPSLRFRIFSWLLHPQIAYFLLLGGIAGLFFELSNPGAVFPGVFGGICLVLGLYAMAVLPVTVAGLLLIFLSVLLFILELAITSYGLLTIAGVVSLFFGSVLLFHFEYGLSSLPLSTILPTVAVVCGAIILALYLVTRAQLKPQTIGSEAMKGLTGRVTRWEGSRGQIMVRGELWRARTVDGEALAPDTTVRVVDIQGLHLLVEPVTPDADE